jgi:imidazolonepropionase-like amidohydrolase
MNPFRKSIRRLIHSGLGLGLLLGSIVHAELLPPGFRPVPLGVHALVGGKVAVKPGETLDPGTVVIRDGLIRAAGTNVPIPADARVWDMKGATIYAGFIEPYLVPNTTNSPISTSESVPISGRSFTSGGFSFYGAPGAQTDAGDPGPGYPIAGITPQFRAAETYSPKTKALSSLRDLGFTAGVVAPAKGILRGTSSLVALSDEDPDKAIIKPDVFQHIAFETHDSDAAVYPASLMGVIAAVRQSFFDAQHYRLDWADYAQHPQSRRRPEFDPALEALQPAATRRVPVMFEPGSALMDDRAAQVSRELGLDFCLVACGQEWRRPDLAKATGATFVVPLNFPTLPKLPSDDDWSQVTLDQLRAWDWAPETAALLRRQGIPIALTTYGLKDRKDFRKNLALARDRGLSENDALAALTTVPARVCGVQDQLGTIEPGKLANLTVVDGNGYFDPDAKVRAVWIDGRIYPVLPEESKSAKAEGLKSGTPSDNAPPAAIAGEKSDRKKEQRRELMKVRVAHSPMEGRGPSAAPPAILIRHATLWTCGPEGILTNAQMFIAGGKIQWLGNFDTQLPADTLVIDAAGKPVTPGIIDCHSHTAILGNANEAGLPSTAMVRISDVVNSETANLYQQLAGGVTTVNLLHGSANPIGGQNCVIQLRDGESPEGLIFSNAPPGIKFALGENVKQSNWGEKFVTRFPQTRMGVRTLIENRFTAAQQYLNAWEASLTTALATNAPSETTRPVPPRRNLELEALGEVLQGKRWIHCHAYRQDEMLMLLRLMQGFGVQIGTFQHALEGYKIADELAAAKVGVSTFSDWWAYKFEVYDAIPYNGTLLRDRGVLVSFNSDSSELARRLYTEAAKAVKYGATPEAEALKFITINPAQQLRIDAWAGSLEPGKDADFVIWSKAPLDASTVCLQTWIGGKKYFDRSLDPARVTRLKQERDALLSKANKMAALSGPAESAGDDGKDDSFFRVSLEHEFDGRDRNCFDE